MAARGRTRCNYYCSLSPDDYEVLKFVPFTPSNKRTEATVLHKHTGEKLRVTKGAPQVILALTASTDEDFISRVDQTVQSLADRGFRSLGVATTRLSENDEPLGVSSA